MNPGLAFGLLGRRPAGLALGGRRCCRWSRWSCWLRVALAHAARAAAGRGASALGLIFGGAVGNLIDRARFGAVVDFVDVYWRGYHWPAFNVADSAITVGVTLLALLRLHRSSGSDPPLAAAVEATADGRVPSPVEPRGRPGASDSIAG